ncbi:MAG: DUF5683 domain-containing protein [Longimicrobiales bacterium]
MKPSRARLWAASGFVVFALLPASVGGQTPDSLRVSPDQQEVPDSLAGEDVPDGPISPAGAFLRSALIPGWGHAKVGAYGRGAFYFAAEAGAAFMFFKSHSRLNLARDRRALWESVMTARFQAEGIQDPDELEEALAGDERVDDLRGLEEARLDQREDWIALGLFFLLLGGADAFVAAHLADFPSPVEVNVTGSPEGRMEVGVSVPVGF